MLDGWIVNPAVAILCFVFRQSYIMQFRMYVVLLSWCCQSQFKPLYLRLLIAHWLCIKIALCHTPHAIYRKTFIVEQTWKKKTKYFYEKQFALLSFACIPSTITVDYMSLKMSFLHCNPLSVWFSHEVIILCLRSKPVAREINVMLQICYYLWLHRRMDPNKKLISNFFTNIWWIIWEQVKAFQLSFLNWEVEVPSLANNTSILRNNNCKKC